MTIEIKSTIKIENKRIIDTLINAFEGGSNYWLEEYSFGTNDDIETHLKNLLDDKATIKLKENDRDNDTYSLTLTKIKKGLQLMADKYDWHFKDLYEENDDADTADVLLQLSAMGELVYG